jgi:uncharacterized protein (TIGR03437 family)
MRRNGFVFSTILFALFVPASSAYIRSTFTFGDGSVVPERRKDNAGIQFYVNDKIGPNFQSSATGSLITVISEKSDPVSAIQAALAAWNGIPGANLKFLPLRTTDKINDPNDNQMTIVVGSTPADVSAVGGALAITVIQSAPYTVGSDDGKGVIADSDIIINPKYLFSTDGSTSRDLQAVMTHELGHSLGMSHSGLLGAVMFQAASFNARYLTADETGFAASVYAGAGSNLGTFNGKVVAADGSPVQAALVTLMDQTAGTAVSALTGADGSYSLQVAAGNYIVYADPLAAGSLVQPANLYLTAATTVTTNFQTTMLGGFASPTTVTLTAGGIANAPNLTVTAGSSALAWPYVGAGDVNGTSANVASTAVLVSSGQAVDLLLIGGGIDGTVSVQAFGKGITVRPGTVRVDPKFTFNGPPLAGQPLVRVTVDVAALDAPALASLIITKGESAFALSGAFVLVPRKPVFTSKSVVSAASFKGVNGDGAVSPGGIYSIYDTAKGSLGPAPYAVPTGYDAYGNLATTLGGVTVTFDGVPAPLYLSYSGQLNLQVPFEVAGKTSTKVVVDYFGSRSDAVSVPVVPAQPAFFTFTPAGTDVIIQNFPDYKLNGADNPIARGGITLLYGTGLGKLDYALATGQPGVVPPATYVSTHSCSFGGKTASAYVYWNYGFVGEAIWTVTVPSDAPTGAVALTCTDSATGTSTQPGLIYVK